MILYKISKKTYKYIVILHYYMNLVKIIKKYNHLVLENTEINKDISIINFNYFIVYYINCLVNDNYMDWLLNQINIIINNNCKIYIIATIQKENEQVFKQNVISIFPSAIIECYYEEEFEYRGIMKVWELGQIHNNNNDIILYFHSKGLTHYTNYEPCRNEHYNVILNNFDMIDEIFTLFPKINKVGFFSGGIGWIWYNFWFARGSYINNVEKPIKTTRRHYYEDWLSRVVDKGDEISNTERDISYYKNTLLECYGFFTDGVNIPNIGAHYNANEDTMYYVDIP